MGHQEGWLRVLVIGTLQFVDQVETANDAIARYCDRRSSSRSCSPSVSPEIASKYILMQVSADGLTSWQNVPSTAGSRSAQDPVTMIAVVVSITPRLHHRLCIENELTSTTMIYNLAVPDWGGRTTAEILFCGQYIPKDSPFQLPSAGVSHDYSKGSSDRIWSADVNRCDVECH